MPRFSKGGVTVVTEIPTEIAELKRDGFREVKRQAVVADAKPEAPKSTK